jgi:hypothetical protein
MKFAAEKSNGLLRIARPMSKAAPHKAVGRPLSRGIMPEQRALATTVSITPKSSPMLFQILSLNPNLLANEKHRYVPSTLSSQLSTLPIPSQQGIQYVRNCPIEASADQNRRTTFKVVLLPTGCQPPGNHPPPPPPQSVKNAHPVDQPRRTGCLPVPFAIKPQPSFSHPQQFPRDPVNSGTSRPRLGQVFSPQMCNNYANLNSNQ